MTLSEAESCWSISGSPHHPHKSAHFRDVVTEALGRGGDCQAPRPCPQPMRYGGTSHWALRAGSEGRPTLQGVKPRQEAEPFTARKGAAEVSGSRDMRLSVGHPNSDQPRESRQEGALERRTEPASWTEAPPPAGWGWGHAPGLAISWRSSPSRSSCCSSRRWSRALQRGGGMRPGWPPHAAPGMLPEACGLHPSLVHQLRLQPQQQLLLVDEPEPVHHERVLRGVCGRRERGQTARRVPGAAGCASAGQGAARPRFLGAVRGAGCTAHPPRPRAAASPAPRP